MLRYPKVNNDVIRTYLMHVNISEVTLMLRRCLLHVCLMPVERLTGRGVPSKGVNCVTTAHPVLLLCELGEGLGYLGLKGRLGGLRGTSQG